MREDLYNKALNAISLTEFVECFRDSCTRCTLSQHGSGPIIHRGNLGAHIMLIGECPGKIEERLRKPFVGPAGELLDKIMASIGLDTDKDMFISNSCFCRPTAPQGSGKENYTPKTDQIIMCRTFINKLIDIVNPQIIIACGRIALQNLFEDKTMSISTWEGKWITHNSHNLSNKVNVFIMTHPAAILHQSSWPDKQQETKRKVWKYMQYFRDTYKDKLL